MFHKFKTHIRNLAAKTHEQAKQHLPLEHESRVKRFFAWLVYIGLLGISGLLILFILMTGIFSIGLPDVRDFEKLAGVESTIILDRDGGILYTIHGEENRKYVPLSDISPYLQKATIAIEDDQFYEHSGFDIPGIIKAFCHEIIGNLGRVCPKRGGSTITQQLAKNAFLSSKRSYMRKLRELIISLRLEQAYDKNKILELYLNRIPYGGNAYGSELASQIFFGKSAKDLNLAESAILAALPRAPSFYSPYGEYAYSKLEHEFTPEEIKTRNIQSISDLKEEEYTFGLVGKTIQIAENQSLYLPGRVDTVLKQMEKNEMILEEERKVALRETHQIEFKRYRANIVAPHFVFYIRRLLEEQFGKEAVEQGGMRVTTTINPDLQIKAEDLVAAQVELNKKNFGGSNGALLSVDAKTGEILAMVGSADYFNDEIDGKVNMAFGYKQPGSSFKPFVYSKAFLNGYSPATVLYDTPTNFGGNYRPDNFSGKFTGPLPVRRALGQSLNIPAIKTYFLAGQEDEILPFVEKLGIEGIQGRKPIGGFGPALAIGSAEVRLFDMVRAYTVYANGGMKKDLVPILKVENRNGKVLYEWKESDIKEEQVLDPQVAYLINDILSDESVKLGGQLSIRGHTVATKTGTSNKEIKKDVIRANNLWAFGYTPQIVTGVWTGNTDGKELALNADGYGASTPIWNKFMTEALKELPNAPFPVPDGIKTVSVSKASGLLPGSDTPADQIITEKFASFNVPIEIDKSFVYVTINKTTGLPADPLCSEGNTETKLFQNHHDPIDKYGTWIIGIKQWVTKHREEDPNFPDFPPAEEPKPVSEADLPRIQITNPAAFTTIPIGQTTITAEATAPLGISKVEFYLDNDLNFVDKEAPFEGKIRVTNFTNLGKKLVTARVFDIQGCTAKATIEVEVIKEPLTVD